MGRERIYLSLHGLHIDEVDTWMGEKITKTKFKSLDLGDCGKVVPWDGQNDERGQSAGEQEGEHSPLTVMDCLELLRD